MNTTALLTQYLKKFKDAPLICGLMSGSSTDGVDGVVCAFFAENNQIKVQIRTDFFIPYEKSRVRALKNTFDLSGIELMKAHVEFGTFLSEALHTHLFTKDIRPQLIGLHGHTVFHQPQQGFSFQLGCGATVAARTQTAVVSNFRQADVALGGQGAPLVPVAERILWPQYSAFLNLGGIANISLHHPEGVKAFDVCPANQLLNHLSKLLGKPYDEGGQTARQGKVSRILLHQLNGLRFYTQPGPRSLGAEQIEAQWLPVLNAEIEMSVADKLCTVTHHIAGQVVHSFNQLLAQHELPAPTQVLVTGGGAYNHYLIEVMNQLAAGNMHFAVPNPQTVDYKEAISFALLALLRVAGLPNCLGEVTGASRAVVGGELHGPQPFV